MPRIFAPAHRITRHDLRLASGSILFIYVAAHLANHALGLVSMNAAEIGLRLAIAFWRSVPGTILLYGAAAIHLALALIAIHDRHSLRMPVAEALRIALGFGIPLLLIAHVTSTRFAFERYGLQSDYARVVWALTTANGEGRQLALLAPGWMHGCLGLNFAFGRKPLYRRLRPLLITAAIALPALSALGFMAIGSELAVLAADRNWFDAHVEVISADQQSGLLNVREAALALYFGAIALVLALRVVRSALARSRARAALHTARQSALFRPE